MTQPLVDVSQHDCPHCTRLVCGGWEDCPGYLRALVDRLEDEQRELVAAGERRWSR